MLGMTIMLLNMATAAEFDNSHTYDAVTKEVTIKNLWGLPIIGTDLAKVRLINYTGTCFVGDCYMYLDANVLSDGNPFLEDYIYYAKDKVTLRTGKTQKYEVWDTTVSYEVPTYETTCENRMNATSGKENRYCDVKETGKKTEYGQWKSYDTASKLTAGKYLLRMKIDVNSGETVDVVPTIMGQTITEWALFTGMTLYERYNVGRDDVYFITEGDRYD
jgi:hypothetical protein